MCQTYEGRMTKGEFTNLLKIARDKSSIIFKYFDMDDDGEIDEFEFICALAHITKTDVNSRVVAIFSIFEDSDKKVCDKEGFEHLIYSILGIQRGKEYSDEAINLKIERLIEKHFIKDNQVNLVEFSHMVWSDKDLKEALLNIGIFGREEVSAGTDVGDLDLTLELNRYKIAENKSEEHYHLSNKPNQTNQGIDEDLIGFMDTKSKLLGLGNYLSNEKEMGVLLMPPEVTSASTNPDSPDLDIKLETILGYRAHDMRMNLTYNPDGRFIYNIAQIAMQLDPKSNSQKHLLQGAEEIICIDTCNHISATGEMGEFPILCLWDNKQMKVLSTFTGPIEKGIALLRFSWNGHLLAVSTCDDQNTIFIFKVKDLLSGDFQSSFCFPRRAGSDHPRPAGEAARSAVPKGQQIARRLQLQRRVLHRRRHPWTGSQEVSRLGEQRSEESRLHIDRLHQSRHLHRNTQRSDTHLQRHAAVRLY